MVKEVRKDSKEAWTNSKRCGRMVERCATAAKRRGREVKREHLPYFKSDRFSHRHSQV